VARLGKGWLGVWLGSLRGSIPRHPLRLGRAGHGRATLGLVRFGAVGCLIRQLAGFESPASATVRWSRHGWVWWGMVRRGWARPGEVRQGMVGCLVGSLRSSSLRHPLRLGAARQGLVWLGWARPGEVRQGWVSGWQLAEFESPAPAAVR
jgi:hypothetical protein